MNGTTDAGEPKSPKVARKEPLWTRGFIALLITQFLVSMNDNLFRWLIVPIGKCSPGWHEDPTRILTLGGVVFLVPFLIFTPYAGYCSDRFSRSRVILGCKITEIIFILMGIAAILSRFVPAMLVVLFLLGAQSAFFSPAKYSSLPMIVPQSRISEANGYYAATTLIACIGGQLLGGILFDATTRHGTDGLPEVGGGGVVHWYIWASALLSVAVIGFISSLFIPRLKAAAPETRFPWNPASQIVRDLCHLFKFRYLFFVALASAFFWGLGALAQTNIDFFGTKYLMVSQTSAMLLLVVLTVGLAVGALIAGKWQKGDVKMGLVPFSAFFIVVFALCLMETPRVAGMADEVSAAVASPWTFPFIYGVIFLFLMGGAAEMFEIPLVTELQVKSPSEVRGRILAANNFFSFLAMALFIVFWGALTDKGGLALSATGVWGVCALITVPVFLITFFAFRRQLPELLHSRNNLAPGAESEASGNSGKRFS